MDLDRYLLINNKRQYGAMSTQETGNTCYFQTYLFVLLCKICNPQLARDRRTLVVCLIFFYFFNLDSCIYLFIYLFYFYFSAFKYRPPSRSHRQNCSFFAPIFC